MIKTEVGAQAGRSVVEVLDWRAGEAVATRIAEACSLSDDVAEGGRGE